MRQIRRENTSPELAIRSQIHKLGLRFLVHTRPITQSLAKPDIVFKKSRVAVYVDGCFWHACPNHATWPKTNRTWWKKKILGNIERDRRHDAELSAEGWTIVWIWEHEKPEIAAALICALIHHRDQN